VTYPKRADEVEIGDTYQGERITGWFFNGRGKVMIESGWRWHTLSPSAEVIEAPLESV
jgi:hypothetical protein